MEILEGIPASGEIEALSTKLLQGLDDLIQ